MRKALIVTALLVMLGGCGLAHQMQMSQDVEAAQAEQRRAAMECERLYPDPFKRPVTPRIRCLNDAAMSYEVAKELSVGNPTRDLVAVGLARVLEIGERYDAGKLTQAQYQLEATQAISDTNSQIAIRLNAMASAAAAQQQASAAMSPDHDRLDLCSAAPTTDHNDLPAGGRGSPVQQLVRRHQGAQRALLDPPLLPRSGLTLATRPSRRLST